MLEKMVDNAWRDSFVVKPSRGRLGRDGPEDLPREPYIQDDSSLLNLEKRANLVKPSGGEGDLFAGTYFEPAVANAQGGLISKGLSLSAAASQIPEPVYEEETVYEAASPNKERRGKSIYNRATQVLGDFAERLSSGGEAVLRRKSSKEELVERDGSKDSDPDRRKSVKPRVKSVVAKLTRATSRRKTKTDADQMFDPDSATQDADPDSTYSATNPHFSLHNTAASAKGISE